MKAIIEVDIPDYQIGQEASIYFKDTMMIKGIVQEPSGDLISRDELLKAIDTWDKFGYTETGCFVREPKGDYVPYIHYDDVIKCIKSMPTVQAVPIPENATNGDVITAIFSSRWHNNEIIFSDDWWYSPYKRGDNNG